MMDIVGGTFSGHDYLRCRSLNLPRFRGVSERTVRAALARQRQGGEPKAPLLVGEGLGRGATHFRRARAPIRGIGRRGRTR